MYIKWLYYITIYNVMCLCSLYISVYLELRESGQIHAQIWVMEEGAGELGSRNFGYRTERILSPLCLAVRFLFLKNCACAISNLLGTALQC